MQALFKFATACALTLAAANAAEIQFTQTGWSTGAILNVSFTGEDQNNDGSLVQTELTSFKADWESPLGVSTTTWRLADIQPDGFFFAGLGDYLLFAANTQFSLVSTAFEGEALASVFDALLFPVDSSATPATAAPEPEGLAVIALAVAILSRVLWPRPALPAKREKE